MNSREIRVCKKLFKKELDAACEVLKESPLILITD